MNTDDKEVQSVKILLSELEYARTSISDVKKQLGKSFVSFYIPILIITGYALINNKINPEINIIFLGTPFLLFAYAGYSAYLNFIQRGFEIYRLNIEATLRDLIGTNPATEYQTSFVPKYYYGFRYWSVSGYITLVFGFITNFILIFLILFPAICFGLEYETTLWNNYFHLIWIIILIILGLATLIAPLLIFLRKAQNIWQYK